MNQAGFSAARCQFWMYRVFGFPRQTKQHKARGDGCPSSTFLLPLLFNRYESRSLLVYYRGCVQRRVLAGWTLHSSQERWACQIVFTLNCLCEINLDTLLPMVKWYKWQSDNWDINLFPFPLLIVHSTTEGWNDLVIVLYNIFTTAIDQQLIYSRRASKDQILHW